MNTSMPWIKLYTEILDDPKIGRLSVSHRWRFVELLLLAGECDQEGCLINGDTTMSLEDIAWRLRCEPEALQNGLECLLSAGLLSFDGSVWTVVKFKERQGRPQREKREQWRVRQERHRGNKITVTGDTSVTHPSRVEESRGEEEESRGEEITKTAAALLTPFEAQSLLMTITGWSRIPGNPEDSANALGAIQDIVRIRGQPEGEKWLRQCYETFRARYPRSTKVFWITDWAVQGVIPNISKNGKDNESWKNEYSAA